MMFLLIGIGILTSVLGAKTWEYRIGTSVKDITGLPWGVCLMGFGDFFQLSKGIMDRTFARAIVIEHVRSRKRLALVNIASNAAVPAVKMEVVRRLQKKGYGKYYSNDNIVLSSTHTHAGGGGISLFRLYSANCINFIKKNFDAVVKGVVDSIITAHKRRSKSGRIISQTGHLDDATINRSKFSYAKNPKNERDKYKSDRDTKVHILRFENERKNPIAIFTLFAQHASSLSKFNRYISGDNFGYSSYLFEKSVNQKPGGRFLYGHDDPNYFIAIFTTSNQGDISPNIRGAFCPGEKTPCRSDTSTCRKKKDECHGQGPAGRDWAANTRLIGKKLFDRTHSLFIQTINFKNAKHNLINGPINYVHRWFDLTKKTCRPAYGYSFVCGTTDGPNMISSGFHQHDLTGKGLTGKALTRSLARLGFNLLLGKVPGSYQKTCQRPKPVFTDLGVSRRNYGKKNPPPVPYILPLQLISFGKQVVWIVVPAEFTTMSSRRLISAVKGGLGRRANPSADFSLVFGNSYSGYVTTKEEYSVQRYEGASTLYGPKTLAVYIEEFLNLASVLGRRITFRGRDAEPKPLDLSRNIKRKLWPIVVCEDPFGKIGKVKTRVNRKYFVGQTVKFRIIGGNPLRYSSLKLPHIFVVEKKKKGNGGWYRYLTDSDWSTTFHGSNTLNRYYSEAKWTIGEDVPLGIYRIVMYGYKKPCISSLFGGGEKSFRVVSKTFSVKNKKKRRNSKKNCLATLYEHCDFGGKQYCVNAECAYMGHCGIPDNVVSAVRVKKGYEIKLFENTYFRGKSKTFGSDDGCLVDDGFNDITSSLKISVVGKKKKKFCPVRLFEHCNFKGKSVCVDGPLSSSLKGISSVRVKKGYEVTLFSADWFGGRRHTLRSSDSCLVDNKFNDVAKSAWVGRPGLTSCAAVIWEQCRKGGGRGKAYCVVKSCDKLSKCGIPGGNHIGYVKALGRTELTLFSDEKFNGKRFVVKDKRGRCCLATKKNHFRSVRVGKGSERCIFRVYDKCKYLGRSWCINSKVKDFGKLGMPVFTGLFGSGKLERGWEVVMYEKSGYKGKTRVFGKSDECLCFRDKRGNVLGDVNSLRLRKKYRK